MKVLIVIGAYPSDRYPENSIFTHCQVKELIKHKIDVTVLEMDLRSIKYRRRLGFHKEFYEGIDVFRCALPIGFLTLCFPFIGRLVATSACTSVFKLIGKPDIIHFHLVESANDYNGVIKKCKKIPILVTEHRCMWLEGKSVYEKRKERIKMLYSAAKTVICVSKVQEKYITSHYDANTIMIPNYIDDKFIYKYRKKKKPFIFMSVGKFEQRKRFDLTIKAFKIFNEKYPDSQLTLVGEGSLLESMKTYARKIGIYDQISFLGKVKNDLMPDLYNQANAFLLPSMDESFGVVYAEAAACGLPIIATDCGGPNDIVNQDNGFLIPVNNVDALVEAMGKIYINYDKYDSQKISQDIHNRFGCKSVITKIIRCYKET